MNDKTYSTAECIYEVNNLINFVAEKGNAISMGEMANVVESLHLIKDKVVVSEIIPSDIKLYDNLESVLKYIRESSFLNVVGRTISSLTSLVSYIESFSK